MQTKKDSKLLSHSFFYLFSKQHEQPQLLNNFIKKKYLGFHKYV